MNAIPMKAIAVEITRLVDASAYPPIVECLLVDAQGQAHCFMEKDAIVSSTSVVEGALPAAGVIGCEVEQEWVDSAGRALVCVTTNKPWGVESAEGRSSFVVLAEQLREV